MLGGTISTRRCSAASDHLRARRGPTARPRRAPHREPIRAPSSCTCSRPPTTVWRPPRRNPVHLTSRARRTIRPRRRPDGCPGLRPRHRPGVLRRLLGHDEQRPELLVCGSVSLSDDDSDTALFTASGLQPGDTRTSCIVVTSTGSLPSTVKLYGTDPATTNALSSSLHVTVTEGTGGSFGKCSGFTPLSPAAVWSGSLADLGSTATRFSNGIRHLAHRRRFLRVAHVPGDGRARRRDAELCPDGPRASVSTGSAEFLSPAVADVTLRPDGRREQPSAVAVTRSGHASASTWVVFRCGTARPHGPRGHREPPALGSAACVMGMDPHDGGVRIHGAEDPPW